MHTQTHTAILILIRRPIKLIVGHIYMRHHTKFPLADLHKPPAIKREPISSSPRKPSKAKKKENSHHIYPSKPLPCPSFITSATPTSERMKAERSYVGRVSGRRVCDYGNACKGEACTTGRDRQSNNRASGLTVPGDFVLVLMRSALAPIERRITPSNRPRLLDPTPPAQEMYNPLPITHNSPLPTTSLPTLLLSKVINVCTY
jgi:hypothetical protein